MAIVTYQTSKKTDKPNTKNSQIFKGFSTQGKTFSDTKLYDIELIKQDLFNHFNIRKGEKLENPEFGTNIYDMLFDPLDEDTKNAIILDIENVINYDPRVVLDQIQLDEYEHGVNVLVSVIYVGYGIGEQMNLLFDNTEGLLIQSSKLYPTAS